MRDDRQGVTRVHDTVAVNVYFWRHPSFANQTLLRHIINGVEFASILRAIDFFEGVLPCLKDLYVLKTILRLPNISLYIFFFLFFNDCHYQF